MAEKSSAKKCSEIPDAPPPASESSTKQEKEIKTLHEPKRKRKLEDSQTDRCRTEKRKKRKETARDKILEWNYFYSNVKFGIWIQCMKCKKWRKSTEYEEEHEVPASWHCSMTASGIQSCDDPEDTEGVEFSPVNFIPGSIVWAKVDGYPWWPGMIEDDPDTVEYYWIEKNTTYFNVTFLDGKVSHAWVPASCVRSYLEPPNQTFKKPKNSYLIEAEKNAKEAFNMSIKDRLEKYSFAQRYKGQWGASESFGEEDDGDEDIAEMLIKELEDIDSVKSLDSELSIGTDLDETQKLNDKGQIVPTVSEKKPRKHNFEVDSKDEIKVVHGSKNGRQQINDTASKLNKALNEDKSPKCKEKATLPRLVKKCMQNNKPAENINSSVGLNQDILVDETKPDELRISKVKKKTDISEDISKDKISKIIKKKLTSKYEKQANNNKIAANPTANEKQKLNKSTKDLEKSLISKVKKKTAISGDISKDNKKSKNLFKKLASKDEKQANSNKLAVNPPTNAKQKSIANKSTKDLEKSYRNLNVKSNSLTTCAFKPPVKTSNGQTNENDSNNVKNQQICNKDFNDKHEHKETSLSQGDKITTDEKSSDSSITGNHDEISILNNDAEQVTRKESGINDDISIGNFNTKEIVKRKEQHFKSGEAELVSAETEKLIHEDMNENANIAKDRQNTVTTSKKRKPRKGLRLDSRKSQLIMNLVSEEDIATISKKREKRGVFKDKDKCSQEFETGDAMNDNSNMNSNDLNTKQDAKTLGTTTKAKNVFKRKDAMNHAKNTKDCQVILSQDKAGDTENTVHKLEIPVLSSKKTKILTMKANTDKEKSKCVSNSENAKQFTVEENVHKQKFKNYQQTKNNKNQLKNCQGDFESGDILKKSVMDSTNCEEELKENIAAFTNNETTNKEITPKKHGESVRFEDAIQGNTAASQNSFQLLKSNEDDSGNEDKLFSFEQYLFEQD